MARLYISNRRGRQQILSAKGRAPRLKEQKDETYQAKTSKRVKGGAKYSVTTPTKARRRQVAARNLTDDESTTSGIESDDDDGVDAEEEDEEEPEVSAPSRAFHSHEAGRYQYDRSDDNLSEAGETDSMFGGSFNPEEDASLQNRLLDDNDDAYHGVDDISESDLDDEKILEQQAKSLLADIASEDVREDSEDPSFYLNQIEGMSAYGFGDDSDGTMQFFGSSQSSDDGNDTLTRHVRFEETFPEQQAFRGFSESPTMTRALLPSALPNTMMHSLTGDNAGDSETDEDVDSDLTDDDLPEAAQDAPDVEDDGEDNLPALDSLPKKLRPPPVGRFIDDGSQSAGILDSTGTMLLITNPQTLGEEFARRYGASAPPSPGMNFAEAVLGTPGPAPDTPGARIPDPMFSGLTSQENTAENGQTVSIPEAFFAPLDDKLQSFNALAEPFDEEGSMFSDMDEAEQMMNIEDIVAFDTDSDDDSPDSPAVTFDAFSSPGLSHLTNGNVMAFRRNADPVFRAMHSSPITGNPAATRMSHPSRSRRAAKRKSRTDSPYNDQYYKGVTPVQRVSHPDNDLPMPASSPTKRQRLF